MGEKSPAELRLGAEQPIFQLPDQTASISNLRLPTPKPHEHSTTSSVYHQFSDKPRTANELVGPSAE
jgi:hypothetical protein